VGFSLFFRLTLLFFIEVDDFELRPKEVGLLWPIGEAEPVASCDESSYHARIVTLSNIYFEPVLIFQGYFNIELVGEIDLPKHISVVKGLEGNDELPFIAPRWRTMFSLR
jgi:hypothetical protein